MKTVQLQIGGMTCAACSARIEKVVGRLPGVNEATVSLPLGQAVVRYDARAITPERIRTRIEEIGYRAQAELADARAANRGEIRDYAKRFAASALLSMPLLWAMLAHLPATSWLPVPALFLNVWFQLGAATLLQLYVAYPFYRGAFHAIRSGAANMDVLVALGTSIAYLYSHRLAFESLGSSMAMPPHLYFDTSAMILTSVLLGKLLESIARGRALKEMGALRNLQAKLVRTEGKYGEEWVPSENVRPGLVALVMPGEIVPVDGTVDDGRTEVDESFLTGESRHVAKTAGDRVFGGSLNLSGIVRIRATATAGETRLAGMIRLVEEAQHSKPDIQRQVDRIAGYAIPFMMLCAAAAYFYWAWNPRVEAGEAFRNAMAVLLVSCPCALGLAAPISILVASGVSARRGILFKEGRSIERLHKVDRFVLDKTGTLTEGRPSLRAIDCPSRPDSYVLRLAAALEKGAAHPVALAIVREADKRRLIVPEAQGRKEEPGQGVRGSVEGRQVAIGSAAWLRGLGIVLPEGKTDAANPGDANKRGEATEPVEVAEPRKAQPGEAMEQGRALEPGGAMEPGGAKRAEEKPGERAAASSSKVHVALDGRWLASIEWTDRLRDESAAAVRELTAYGEIVMATGDEEEAARRIAAEAGIGAYYARMLPENKLEMVRRLQAEGRTVAMIGDGVNDAAALAAADVGLVMDSGTAAAVEAGDVVLLKGQLRKAAQAVSISRLTMRNIRQNLTFSLLYNGFMIPFAASGRLDPRVACLTMALSSVLVVCNSLRLTWRLADGKGGARHG